MNIIYDFIAQSMQDRRALINYLLTMNRTFTYNGDTEHHRRQDCVWCKVLWRK